MPLTIRCFFFPRSVELTVDNIGEAKHIRIFIINELDVDQQYTTLVEKIREKYDSLTTNEQFITRYLHGDQLITFDSGKEMEFGVRYNRDRDSRTFDIYVGRTADQKSDKNKQGYF
jgi:hypothetical protein